MAAKTFLSLLVASLLGALALIGASPLQGLEPGTATSALPRVLPCSGKPVLKPSSYVVACADANTYLKATHWSSWTSTRASGTAAFWQNDCTPYCAAGKFHSYRATVVLSSPRVTKLGRLFSELVVTYRVGTTTKRLSQALPLKVFG